MTRQENDPPRIERLRRQAVARYPGLWKRLTGEWRADSADDCAWLVYSANYILRTQNVRWAIDPLTLRWRVPEAEPVPIQRSLAQLSFVVLTHRHADHLDLDLVRRLNRLPILWIVPESLRPRRSPRRAEAELVEVAGKEVLDIGPIRIRRSTACMTRIWKGRGRGRPRPAAARFPAWDCLRNLARSVGCSPGTRAPTPRIGSPAWASWMDCLRTSGLGAEVPRTGTLR
jgi:hypothetical protein